MNNLLFLPNQATMQHTLRSKFTDGGLATASGPKIIQLCYERLDRDLDGALVAIDDRDIAAAHELLCHAQDIVHELLCMLDLDKWEHAGSLAAIYRYVLDLLTEANVRKSAAPAREARHLLGELGEAFRLGASASMPEQAPISQFSARA
jgi:flagellar secretion chaperone FliS